MTRANRKTALAVFSHFDHPVIRLLSFSVLLFCLYSPSTARGENDPSRQGNYARELIRQGDFEKGLEQLRSTYRIFPLNEPLKRNLAEGYAAYGHTLLKQRRYEQADENFAKAIELYPDDPSFAFMRGVCNYLLKKYDVARYELERARGITPDNVDTLYYLGLVVYETDDRPQAIELWEQALKLAPGRKDISDQLARAHKEMAVEDRMDQGHSSRFNLTYDPDVSSTLAQAVLDVLEEAYNQVGADMGSFPDARIPVVIYKRSDFQSVTDSPDWSGGLYDGTIRLPFGTMENISAPMRGILFHEYAHVVVFELTHGNCPTWLNEGIAEMFGRSQYARSMPENHAARFAATTDVRKLEKGFGGFASKDALMAYQQSYSLVNYLVNTYGWPRVTQILTDLGNGMNMDEAVSATLKSYDVDYNGLVKEWRQSVARSTTGE
ncbi:MAG: peptidase MA family metallohydrolase [Geobacteraceae bacterium]|nr:peptidase MA family metallohydrolase [Geobacteraceae bacterium]